MLIRVRRLGAYFALVLAIGACHRSGSWVDDPKNFRRAFGYDPPEGVEVHHSWYWRSPHFFREESFLFALQASPTFIDEIIHRNGMTAFGFPGLVHFSKSPCVLDEWPQWFAPGSPQGYEAWRCPSPQECLALVSRTSNRLYLYFCQL